MLLLSRVALAAGRFLLPILLILAVCSLSASLLQNLPRFVLDRITPKWSRVSPMAGFARIFGTSGQVEFLKSSLNSCRSVSLPFCSCARSGQEP